MLSGVVSRVGNYAVTRLALVLVVGVSLCAQDSLPVRVVDVQSALRLTIKSSMGGSPGTMPFHLEGLRLIGPNEHQLTKPNKPCPPDCEVTLQVTKQHPYADAFGVESVRALMVSASPNDPVAKPPRSNWEQCHRNLAQATFIFYIELV